ncbi:MAG: beta-lactamase family protein [Pseudomonadales bacterium]|nr:beta-lactamase family protein [Pseudomonadales bacterium]
MNATTDLPPTINGTVAPGFESVRALYEYNMQNLAEQHTQLCVYHRGEKVVDLWGSACEPDSFSPDSLINVFSSGKSLEAIALASLVDKGLLDYQARVCDYWPGFASNGKQAVTVADLMRHEAGLAALDGSINPVDLHTHNLKENRVGQIIEQQVQRFRPDSPREYHAITRGWIVNELFRRVDPNGRTIGEFLQEELSGPLGADVMIGVPEDQLSRVSKVQVLSLGYQFAQSFRPRLLNRRTEHNIFGLVTKIARMAPNFRKRSASKVPPPFTGMNSIGFFNHPDIVRGESPSANANCTARGLARVAAMMAQGGEWQGKRFLSQATWDALHDEPVEADMLFGRTTFTQGGVAHFNTMDRNSNIHERALNHGREGFYGWMGLGGSIFQWHPGQQIGFGYVPTSLNVLDFVNERGKAYQTEVLRCVEQRNRQTAV